MGIKDQLLKLKKKINAEIASKTLENSIELSDKVECFLDWYYENVAKEGCTEIGAKGEVENIKNFMNKLYLY